MQIKYSLLASSAVLAAVFSPVVRAQEQAADMPVAQQSPSGDGDIVVTARRREEGLSKVPVAISAFGSEALEKQSIRSEADLQSAVPGLTIRESGSNNIINYSIRGQSIDAYTNSPPAVLPYINEFQVSSFSASAFFDLENVQVLKGPQGTLFGRNTTGGAVLYQTARPGNEAKGFFSVRGGNFDNYQVQAAATVPLAPWASLRIAGNISDGGAYVRNLYTGKKVGDNTNKAVRGTLAIEPIDGLRNSVTVQYSTDRGTNTPTLAYQANACGATLPDGTALNAFAACLYTPGNPTFDALVAARPDLYPGGIQSFVDYQKKLGPWKAMVNSPLTHRAKTLFIINTTEVDLTDELTLKNIIGWNKSSKNDRYDFDGSPYGIYENRTDTAKGQAQSTRQFSEELQLQGKVLDGALDFTIGVYYANQRDSLVSEGQFFDLSPLAPFSPLTYVFAVTDRSLAGFAQATYNITDALHLTGGFRYSQDKITGRNLPGSVYGVTSQKLKNDKESYTASLDYQVTPQLMVYATTRGSWRAGGFNFTGTPIDETGANGGNIFLPETTKDVEVGAKYNGYVGGMRFNVTADVYTQWVKNVQRANFQVINGNPALFTGNVPKAKISGGELSVTLKPASWLELGGAGTYTDAKFTDPVGIIAGVPVTYGPYADVAKWSGSAYAQLTKELAGNAGSVSLRGDIYGQTGVYFSNLADSYTPGTRIPGYTITNLRLSWDDVMGENVSLALYVRNVFNKEYYAGGLPAGSGFGVNSVSPGRPRMYGAEMRFNF
ncbi:iron complex outermembrane recepter protein [Sphingobium faniae]|nr:iron complex outermembrane recepter protein [Sphingobium faniae]